MVIETKTGLTELFNKIKSIRYKLIMQWIFSLQKWHIFRVQKNYTNPRFYFNFEPINLSSQVHWSFLLPENVSFTLNFCNAIQIVVSLQNLPFVKIAWFKLYETRCVFAWLYFCAKSYFKIGSLKVRSYFCVKFCIVPKVMQTQLQRISPDSFSAFAFVSP